MNIEHFNWSADLAFAHMVENKGKIMEYVDPVGAIIGVMWNGAYWIKIDKYGLQREASFTSYMTRVKFRPKKTKGGLQVPAIGSRERRGNEH